MLSTLSAKILAAFAVILGLLLLTAGVGLWQMRKSDVAADDIACNFLPSIEALGTLDSNIQSVRSMEYGIILSKDASFRKTRMERIAERQREGEAALKSWGAMEMEADERTLMEAVKSDWDAYHQIDARIAERVQAGDADGAMDILAKGRELFDRLDDSLRKAITVNHDEAAAAKLHQDAVVANAYWFCAIAAGGSIILGILLARLMAGRIVRPVGEVKSVLEGLAQGDLRQRSTVSGRDELASMSATLNGTMAGLGGMVGGIAGNAQGIAGAAEELATISKQLTGNAETVSSQSNSSAAAANQIAQSMGTVSAGVEEMGASIGEIAKNAGQAAEVAKEGVGAADEARTAMDRLSASSQEIGAIIKLITGISEQTNLLALNATIEAARAGEAGRGFAVVASEVKDLARKTGQATSDIAGKVGGIQADAQAAQAALLRIREIVGRISELQQSIASAVEEQSATTREFAGNISQVAQAGTSIASGATAVADAARETTSGAAETQKAAQELARLAEELRGAVSRFQL